MRTRSHALIALTAALMALTAGAPAIASVSQGSPCTVGNVNNGAVWGGFNANLTGHARFYEYDEKLEVVDTSSNGERVNAYFQVCSHDGEGNFYYRDQLYSPHDSGPDEGNVDREWYDFTFYEGLKVRFKVCDGDNECGHWQYANT